ncbi:TPA: hypothetical protein ACH3X1_009814 [Trebouxia sp. C0004]
MLTLGNFCTAAHDITISTCCHMYKTLILQCAELYIDVKVCCDGAGLNNLHHHAASWRVQFRVLYWRSIVSSITDPLDVGARILTALWLGVFVGLVFLRLPSGTAWRACMTVTCYISPVHPLNTWFSVAVDEQGAQGRVLCIADSLLVLIFTPFVYMPLIMSNKETLARDAPAKLYSNIIYYCAVTLANMPATVLTALAFIWPVYSLAGFRHSVPALAQASCMYALQHLCSTQASSQGLKPQDYPSLIIVSAGSVVIVGVFLQSIKLVVC